MLKAGAPAEPGVTLHSSGEFIYSWVARCSPSCQAQCSFSISFSEERRLIFTSNQQWAVVILCTGRWFSLHNRQEPENPYTESRWHLPQNTYRLMPGCNTKTTYHLNLSLKKMSTTRSTLERKQVTKSVWCPRVTEKNQPSGKGDPTSLGCFLCLFCTKRRCLGYWELCTTLPSLFSWQMAPSCWY